MDVLKKRSSEDAQAFFLCNPQNPGRHGVPPRRARAPRRADARPADRLRRDPLRPAARRGHAARADRQPGAGDFAPHRHPDVAEQDLQLPGRRLRLGDHRGRRICARRSPPSVDAHVMPLALGVRLCRRAGGASATATTGSRRSSTTCAETATWSSRRSACRWRTSRRPISPGSTARRLRGCRRALPEARRRGLSPARSSAMRASCGSTSGLRENSWRRRLRTRIKTASRPSPRG